MILIQREKKTMKQKKIVKEVKKMKSNKSNCWEIQPSDITSEVCNKCIKSGPPYCCEISLGFLTQESKMYLDLVKIATEGTDIRTNKMGEIFMICSHLDKEKGVCKIYETRPQMCRIYNCVSWAQVASSQGASREDLLIYNKVEEMMVSEQTDYGEEKEAQDGK